MGDENPSKESTLGLVWDEVPSCCQHIPWPGTRCCKGKVLPVQRWLFVHGIPKAAAQIGFQKRLLNFLPDLSHLESLRGSSHTPPESRKVNSLLGSSSDRGWMPWGQAGLFPFHAFFSEPHLPGSGCHSKPMCVTTDVTQGSHSPQRAANTSSSNQKS